MLKRIPVYQSTCIPLTKKNTSIPVHLYTCRCRHHATPVLMSEPCMSTPPLAVEIQPVIAPWTTSVPAALVEYQASRTPPCTALVEYQASRTTPAPPWCNTRPPGSPLRRPGVIPGLQDHSYTTLVEYKASKTILRPCLVKIPGL